MCVVWRVAPYQSASWPVCLCTVLVMSCTEWRVKFRLTFSASVASVRDGSVEINRIDNDGCRLYANQPHVFEREVNTLAMNCHI